MVETKLRPPTKLTKDELLTKNLTDVNKMNYINFVNRTTASALDLVSELVQKQSFDDIQAISDWLAQQRDGLISQISTADAQTDSDEKDDLLEVLRNSSSVVEQALVRVGEVLSRRPVDYVAVVNSLRNDAVTPEVAAKSLQQLVESALGDANKRIAQLELAIQTITDILSKQNTAVAQASVSPVASAPTQVEPPAPPTAATPAAPAANPEVPKQNLSPLRRVVDFGSGAIGAARGALSGDRVTHAADAARPLANAAGNELTRLASRDPLRDRDLDLKITENQIFSCSDDLAHGKGLPPWVNRERRNFQELVAVITLYQEALKAGGVESDLNDLVLKNLSPADTDEIAKILTRLRGVGATARIEPYLKKNDDLLKGLLTKKNVVAAPAATVHPTAQPNTQSQATGQHTATPEQPPKDPKKDEQVLTVDEYAIKLGFKIDEVNANESVADDVRFRAARSALEAIPTTTKIVAKSPQNRTNLLILLAHDVRFSNNEGRKFLNTILTRIQ